MKVPINVHRYCVVLPVITVGLKFSLTKQMSVEEDIMGAIIFV